MNNIQPAIVGLDDYSEAMLLIATDAEFKNILYLGRYKNYTGFTVRVDNLYIRCRHVDIEPMEFLFSGKSPIAIRPTVARYY